ncbi:MAG: VanW family protein [Veillonellales bacterium]
MKKWRVALLATFLLVTGTAGWCCIHSLFWNRVYAGVALEGVEIGGCSRDEVAQILAVWQKEQSNRHVMAYYGDKLFGLEARSIDFDIDIGSTVDEVWNFGRSGSLWDRLKNIHLAMTKGYPIPVRVRYNETKLDNLVEQWKTAIERQPRNAALSLVNGGVIPQEQGCKLETERLRPLVLQALKGTDDTRIPLPVTLLEPSVTVSDIERIGIREMMGTFTTVFNPADQNRTANIKIAARKINGQMIEPGGVFSFNEIVGPREKSLGFKEAMEYVDGELVPGIGGGICQVSSTIYNAALLANLKIAERYNHSKPLGYIPLGRDATVAYGVLDFKFVNNTASPVMIMAEAEDDKLVAGIFGPSRPAAAVEIVSANQQLIPPAVVKQQDGSLYLGESKVDKQGKPGYEITTIRIIRLEGQEIKREILSTDRYLPENTIVKIGSLMPPFAVGNE